MDKYDIDPYCLLPVFEAALTLVDSRSKRDTSISIGFNKPEFAVLQTWMKLSRCIRVEQTPNGERIDVNLAAFDVEALDLIVYLARAAGARATFAPGAISKALDDLEHLTDKPAPTGCAPVGAGSQPPSAPVLAPQFLEEQGPEPPLKSRI